MAEPRSEGSLVRYYCTYGKGMEPFLIDEVKRKLAAEDVCQISGKVLFSSSAGIDRVSELKAAERLFLLLKKDSPVLLPAHTNQAKASSLLQSRVLGDKDQWSSAVMTWSRLQGELSGKRRTTVKSQSTALGVTRKTGEEGRGSQELKREIVERGGQTCGAEAQTLEKKRKRDEGENESSSDKNAEDQRTSERDRKRHCEEEDEEERMGLHHNVEGSGRNVDNTAEDLTVQKVEHGTTTEGRDETLLQPSLFKPEPPSPAAVTFRISCKCTGSLSRYYSQQEVSRVIGVGLSRLMGWKADLKNPQLEVNVYLSDDNCLVGFPLTRLPLANRSYIKTTGLRSTVAWAMASLAQIQPGFCVVDPMCGVGTILIEAAQDHQDVCFLGMDIDDGQLKKANENVEFAELGNRMHLLKASSMTLPLPSSTVDAVVCDLPLEGSLAPKQTWLPTCLSSSLRWRESSVSVVPWFSF
ncbi:THUMP domain containing protein 2 [Dissostichus eleginoides]|uniref:THUMP domain containing protein 2 n=1 Tax=Dissostichus eleginoides TaxID=100907 RepID=A0AAD9CTG4_DISEL|nr:THUMP domain containing protein 2 [Dissostichus eleginoides]